MSDVDWLDEDSEEAEELSVVEEAGESKPARKSKPSAHAVKLDAWGKRRGEDLAKDPEVKKVGSNPVDLADMYGMAFEYEPELVEQCADPDKLQFLDMLRQDANYQALHVDTQLDVMASEIAAVEYARQFKLLKEKREEQKQQQQQRQQQQQQKGQQPQPQQQGQQQQQQQQPSPQEQLRQEMEAMRAAAQAVAQAEQQVEELREMQTAMGIGSEAGSGGQTNTASLKQMYQRIKRDPQLKEICEKAGRYRVFARSQQRQKLVHGYDDMIGIKLDNDIPRLLPHELAALTHPMLKLDAMRRFVERTMMCRERRGVKRVGKGPIMVWLDESGSMDGDKIVHAKAIALTMAWIARVQKRWCALVAWSSAHQLRTIVLPPKNWDQAALMNWLSGFLNGGTHLPLADIPKVYEQTKAVKGKTDILIITDGDTESLAVGEAERFQQWKKEYQAKVIGISIQSNAATLKQVSDTFYKIPMLGTDSEAVGQALSI